jgi:hypothetical protein
MSEKSFELFSKEHAATQKFDYFICSVAGALFAYIGQTYTPQRLESIPQWFIPAALLCLALCLLFGLIVIHQSNAVTKYNKESLQAYEIHTSIESKFESSPQSQQFRYEGKQRTRSELLAFSEKELKNSKDIEDKALKLMKVTEVIVFFRNVLLILGFLLILTSKVWQPYIEAN